MSNADERKPGDICPQCGEVSKEKRGKGGSIGEAFESEFLYLSCGCP